MMSACRNVCVLFVGVDQTFGSFESFGFFLFKSRIRAKGLTKTVNKILELWTINNRKEIMKLAREIIHAEYA